jgi:hypothetical protein
LLDGLGTVSGVRYVDDYYLYFVRRDQAERALNALDAAANYFEVEIHALITPSTKLMTLFK